jgi:hypothetical protein
MKVLKKKSPEEPSILFDGEEKEYYKFRLFSKIPITSFKYLCDLIFGIDQAAMNVVIKEIKGIKHEPFDSYVSSYNGLDLQYHFDEVSGELIIISTGERQPGRYQIFLEQEFKID